MSRPVIVLRPEPGASATVARAKAMHLDARACPLFEARGIAWSCPDPAAFTAILFTSANGARLCGPGRQRYIHLPAFAVGDATAEAARETGFTSVITGESNIAQLVAKIATLGKHRLLHLSGAEVSEVDFMGIEVERRIVYDTITLPPTATMLETLSAGGIALVHSARAGERLAEVALDRGGLSLVAISARAAEAAGTGWQRLVIADHPRDEAVLEAAARLALS